MATQARLTRPAFGQPVKADKKPIAADHETIARLAYQYWEARGCPSGSPDEDWRRAENDLRRAAAG